MGDVRGRRRVWLTLALILAAALSPALAAQGVGAGSAPGPGEQAQAGQGTAVSALGLKLARGPLPPADLNLLDGLGTAHCDPPTGRLDRLLYEHLRGQGANLSCGNRFGELLEFPGPTDAARPYGTYHALAERIRRARRSVMIANMVWDQGPGAPGALIAAAVADLRRQVLAHPAAYPQGMQVRLLMGNSVRPDLPLDARANLDYAANDLLRADLPLNGVPEGGWRLDLANFGYAAPHSHLKLFVFDEREVIAGGFNISTLHLAPASGGEGLSDLGLSILGPVARHAAAAFHDTWRSSDRLTCPAGTRPGTLFDLRRACRLGPGSADFALVWPPAEAEGNANVYPLYRRSGLETADDALVALLGAAQGHIDLLQAQVSGSLRCDLSLGMPGRCNLATQGLPVWQAIAAAARRGVRVRLVLAQVYPMKFEAASLVRSLQEALGGAAGNLEVRWAGHPMHTKAALIDGQMAVVGSANLHFSSFGPGGLSEYSLATSDPQALAGVQAVFDREWSGAQAFRFPWWAR